MALDLRLVHDFTHSVPGALSKLPDKLKQPSVHLFREACYLLFYILFALDDNPVLIRIAPHCFGGILTGNWLLCRAKQCLQRDRRVLRGLLGVRRGVRRIDDHCRGFVRLVCHFGNFTCRLFKLANGIFSMLNRLRCWGHHKSVCSAAHIVGGDSAGEGGGVRRVLAGAVMALLRWGDECARGPCRVEIKAHNLFTEFVWLS